MRSGFIVFYIIYYFFLFYKYWECFGEHSKGESFWEKLTKWTNWRSLTKWTNWNCPPCAVRKVIRQAKENRQGLLLVNCKKSKTFTKSLKPPSDAAPMPTAYLKGLPENTFICLLSSTIKCLTPETSQMAGKLFYGLIKLQIELFGNKYWGWVWCKKKDAYNEKNLILTVKHGGGSVMLWASFSSKGPGHLVRLYSIMKFQPNRNLAALVRNPKLDRRWIFQQDNDLHMSKHKN